MKAVRLIVLALSLVSTGVLYVYLRQANKMVRELTAELNRSTAMLVGLRSRFRKVLKQRDIMAESTSLLGVCCHDVCRHGSTGGETR